MVWIFCTRIGCLTMNSITKATPVFNTETGLISYTWDDITQEKLSCPHYGKSMAYWYSRRRGIIISRDRTVALSWGSSETASLRQWAVALVKGLGASGKSIAARTVRRIACKAYRLTGVRQNRGERKGTHLFRHYTATKLLENGVRHSIISRALGHTNPDSLGIYLHTDFKHLSKCVLSLETKPLQRSERFPQNRKSVPFSKGFCLYLSPMIVASPSIPFLRLTVPQARTTRQIPAESSSMGHLP